METQSANLNTEVTVFLDGLKHPFRAEIELLRNLILQANSNLIENIKWNSPNYCFENKDRITMRINPPKQIQLIFHCGAKVQELPKDKLIKENFDMLVWKANDRAVATFNNEQAIINGKDDLVQIINKWLAVTK
ncbi:MAG TPA: DUF1801 domain-containing protein [Bacteroidales bacterium]|nr:DUF1801 domain-containing protein [Bacteroidales bacterium]